MNFAQMLLATPPMPAKVREDLKKCSKCGETYDISHFGTFRADGTIRTRSQCRKCRQAKAAEWRKKKRGQTTETVLATK